MSDTLPPPSGRYTTLDQYWAAWRAYAACPLYALGKQALEDEVQQAKADLADEIRAWWVPMMMAQENPADVAAWEAAQHRDWSRP